jgi:hypothetical protein
MSILEDANVLEAARDEIKFLLDRGYRKDSAVDFVGDHHHIDASCRSRLMRETYSELEIEDTSSKLVSAADLSGRDLAIDGFNVLITLDTLLSGGEAFVCQDGMVRDNARAFSNYRIGEGTETAADSVIGLLAAARPASVTWVFDSQISGSGRLAEYVRRAMEAVGVRGRCMTSPEADAQILKLNMITATSDTPMIRRLEAVVDLPQAVVESLQEEQGDPK